MTTIKKFTIAFLYVAILSQLAILISCKDDELTQEEKQQKQEQEADEQFLLTSEFWQVVGQLSNAEVLPDDWQNANFEPGIGQASDKSTTTRIVLTNDAEAAAESFENLTGANVTNLDSYEWKRDFGTLTYKKSHDGQSWATVDVDIKQMPGLKRIVYCTPEQQGLNADVPGTPFYRFGDVIKRLNAENVWEYWVCVRPCFGLEGKGDSHWMCLGSLPESNIKTYEHDTRKWYYHKSLTTNDEHIKNLSEMIFAILNPTEWQQYYDKNQRARMFHDFHYENIAYHNKNFWKKVQFAWNTKLPEEGDKTVFELLFHRTMEDMKDYPQINFFYGSASGPNLFSWYLKMQTASVSLRKDIIEFRKLIKKTHNKSCDEKSFDIHEYSEFGKPSTSTYFENTGTYIYPLRYATGKQLAGFQPGYYQSLHNVNRIQNVYVFNDYFRQDVGSDNKMKVAREENMKPFETRGLFFLGDVVRDENDNTWICVQDSKNTTYDDYTSDYAYFISFDKNALGATPAKGPIEDFRNLPSRNLAIQMTWTLETTIRNSILSGGLALLQIQNINKYAGYDMMYMYPNRDSLHAHNDRPDLIHDVPCSFSNALYRTDDNKIGIVRLIGDYTSSQGEFGSRDMSWRIYDSYTKDLDKAPRKMLLGDLMNVSVIKQYNYDRWVTLKWEIHDQNNDKSYYPSQGLRTEPLNTDDLSVWLLSNQTPKAFIQSDNRVKNMYSEPVMAFAVKRVLDVMGVYPDYKFEDGTKFMPISLMKDVDKDLFCESTHPFFSFTYNNYKEKIFINDVRGEFGLYNTK